MVFFPDHFFCGCTALQSGIKFTRGLFSSKSNPISLAQGSVTALRGSREKRTLFLFLLLAEGKTRTGERVIFRRLFPVSLTPSCLRSKRM